MSITFFSRQVGQVAAFIDPTIPARTLVRLENWDGYQVQKSIITQATFSAQANLQFLHTMGGNIFIYVFGDRIGTMSLSGLSFDSTCDSAVGVIGVENVVQYYNQYRAVNRQLPLKITLGVATTFTAYLIGVSCQIADPKSRIWEFNYRFAIIPFPKNRKALADKAASKSTAPAAPVAGVVDPPVDWIGAGGSFIVPSTPVASLDPGGSTTETSVENPVAAGNGFAPYGTGPNTNLTLSVQ